MFGAAPLCASLREGQIHCVAIEGEVVAGRAKLGAIVLIRAMTCKEHIPQTSLTCVFHKTPDLNWNMNLVTPEYPLAGQHFKSIPCPSKATRMYREAHYPDAAFGASLTVQNNELELFCLGMWVKCSACDDCVKKGLSRPTRSFRLHHLPSRVVLAVKCAAFKHRVQC